VAGPGELPGRGPAEPAPSSGGAAALRTAYLTFDDGPSGLTPQILTILRREDIRATFFVTGSELEQHKELVRQMAAEGHVMGNHTYSHDYARLYRSEAAFMEDVRKLDRALLELTGTASGLIRFPGGSNTRLGRAKGGAWMLPRLVRRVQEEGYQYFDWNVSSTDAAQAVQPKDEIVGAVLSAAARKQTIIVLMHDARGKTTTVEALPEVVRGLREMGFHFEVLRKDSLAVHFLE
jgi:peptidoglycan/xylan/chitin deacetylase (PgdA/CDA1 family)